MPEMGEYIVGAYLKFVEGCEFVDYDVHFPGGGLEGLKELDVIGFDFNEKTAFLCEVTTHVEGMLYGSSQDYTVKHVGEKYERQKQYAQKWLSDFPNRRFMIWSPIVPKGIAEGLSKFEGLELIINREYTERLDRLRDVARKTSQNVGNPAFRVLQVLEHLRR